MGAAVEFLVIRKVEGKGKKSQYSKKTKSQEKHRSESKMHVQ